MIALMEGAGERGSSLGPASECLCEFPPVGLDFPIWELGAGRGEGNLSAHRVLKLAPEV